jgi:hypothetical protein
MFEVVNIFLIKQLIYSQLQSIFQLEKQGQ